MGAAVQPKIKVNGQDVGKSTARGFLFIDREPGKYHISTKTEVERTLDLILEEGDERYVRFGVSMGFFAGHVYPELVEPAKGMQEVQQLHYIGDYPFVIPE